MNPLSTSNSKYQTRTLRLNGLRPWGLLIALVIIGILEVVVHYRVPEYAPPQSIFPSRRVCQQYRQWNEIKSEREIDILFLGTSVAECALIPGEFDNLCQRENLDIKSYNLGIAGGMMSAAKALLDRFFLPSARPKLVYICLSPNGLNLNAPPHVHEITSEFKNAAKISSIEMAFAKGLKGFYLYSYRRTISSFVKSMGKRGFVDLDKYKPLSPGGHIRFEDESQEFEWSRMADFEPDLESVEALHELGEWCVDIGAKYVIVDLPISETNRNLSSPEQRARYLEVLQKASLPGVKVLRIDENEFPAGLFNDGIHLNLDGARKMTAILAADACQRLKEKTVN